MRDLPYAVGDTVKYVGRDNYGALYIGDTGVVTDIGDGIFPPDVYVTVLVGKRSFTGYDWRFEKVKTTETT